MEGGGLVDAERSVQPVLEPETPHTPHYPLFELMTLAVESYDSGERPGRLESPGSLCANAANGSEFLAEISTASAAGPP